MKKKLAACAMALTMAFAGAGLPAEVFQGVFGRSTMVAEAVKSADGKYNYSVNSDGTAKITAFLEDSATLTYPATVDGYTISGMSPAVSLKIFSPALSSGKATTIIFADGVTAIPSQAFMDITSITSVQIPSSVTSIGAGALKGTGLYNNQSGIKYAGSWVIGSDTTVTSVSVNSGTIGLADSAFSGCTSLTSVTIPDGIQYIGKRVFGGCTALTTANLSAVKTIPNSLFDGCTNLKTVNMSSNLTRIGDYAFRNTAVDSTFTIPSSVTSVGVSAFDSAPVLTGQSGTLKYVNDWLVYADSSLTSVTIPSSAKHIADQTFASNTSLTSLTFQEGCTSIGFKAFSGCTGLRSVTFPSTLRVLDEEAFSNCSANLDGGLNEVTLPSGIASIGVDCFTGCTWLTELTIPSTSCTMGARCAGYSSTTSVKSDFTLHVYENSTAKAYAQQYNVKYDIIGGGSHTHSYGEWETFKAATCTVKGEKRRYCSCGEYESQEIPATGHTKQTVAAKAATCTQAGNIAYYYCPVCKKYFSNSAMTAEITQASTVISALGHNKTAVAAKAATCTTDGNIAYWHCSRCDKYFSDSACTKEITKASTVIAGGHTWGSPSYSWSDDGKTCTGKRVCTRNSTHIETVNATVTSAVKTAATCKTKGTTRYTASFSNSAYTTQTKDIQDIPLAAHSYQETVVAPTATTQGYTLHHCSVCGDEYKDNYTDPTGQTAVYSITLTTGTKTTDRSYAYQNNQVTLTFKGSSTKSVTTSNKQFSVPSGLANGSYTLTVASNNFATRSYTVTVSNGNLTADPGVTLCLRGDVNADGTLSTTDITLIKKYLKKTGSLDDYQAACADADGDGVVRTNDITAIKSHMKGTKYLW